MAEAQTISGPTRPRHWAFYVGLVAGLVSLVVGLWLYPPYAFAVGVNTLFVVYLVLISQKIRHLTPDVLRRHADDSNTPTWIILGVVVAVVAISVFELFAALNGRGRPALEEIAIGLVSVVLGWFTIHTMAALHYAFEYYQSDADAAPDAPPHVGGLSFPKEDRPGALAFVYFSYAIGTSTAVSDVSVTSNPMRKLVLLHSVFSFFFNTLIVAAMVNVTVAVGAG